MKKQDRKVRYKKQVKMSFFEKSLYFLAAILLVFSPVMLVFSQATLSKINFEVEKTKKQINIQKKTNESLEMAIDELASLTKIQEVATEQGLSYNKDNIKTIEDK